MGLSEIEKVLSLHLWIRFAALWFAVVLIGFIEGYILLPFGLAAFVGAVFLTAFMVLVLRRSGYGNRSRRLQIANDSTSHPSIPARSFSPARTEKSQRGFSRT
jgi:hypothetical protein